MKDRVERLQESAKRFTEELVKHLKPFEVSFKIYYKATI